MVRLNGVETSGSSSSQTSELALDAPLPKLRRYFSVSLLLLLTGLLVMPLDCAVDAYFKPPYIFGELEAFLERVETFGHGYGILLMLLTWVILCRPSIRRIVALTAPAYGAGLLANLIKVFVVRVRPNSLPASSTTSPLSFLDPTTMTVSTLMSHVQHRSEHSFPSGHTATAIGFAVVLGSLYPRGRCWLFILGAMVGCQRMSDGSHFLSDVLCGAALGIAVGGIAIWHLVIDETRQGLRRLDSGGAQ